MSHLVKVLVLGTLVLKMNFALSEGKPSVESPQSHLQPYPQKVLRNEIVNFFPVEGFQINLEAPNSCGGGVAVLTNKKKVQCQFKTAGKHQPKIYVCDDGKKTCFIEKVTLQLDDHRNFLEKLYGFFLGESSHYPNHTKVSPNKKIEGFIHNDLELAQKVARRENKQILVYSTQQYCPPCMLLKEFTLSSEKFKKLSQNLVLVQLDSEIDKYNQIKKEWGIKYTPTLVLVNADLEELGKIVSFISPSAFEHWLREMGMYKGEPLKVVSSRIKKGVAKDVDYERLGKNKFRGSYDEEALELLQKVGNRSESVRQKIDYLKAKKTSGLERLEGAVALNKNHPHFSQVMELLWEVLNSEKLLQKQHQKTVSNLLKSIVENKGKYISRNPGDWDNVFDLMYMKRIYSTYLMKIEQEKLAREQTEEAIALIRSMASTEAQKQGEGLAIYEASLRSNIGELEGSSEIYDKRKKKDPGNFTFEYLKAYNLFERKEFEKALLELKNAEVKAKGKQWIQVKKLELDILIKTKRFAEAEKEIQKQLKNIHLPEDKNARVHGFVSSLRKFQGQLKMM